MQVWRLARAALCATPAAAFSGEGAAIVGGRWNRKGSRLCYASWSRSLTVLEILVHIDRQEMPADYFFVSALIEERDVATLAVLPPDWRNPSRSAATVSAGEAFIAERSSLALTVPSVIVPGERNYLINPVHPRFRSLRISDVIEPSAFDSRLFTA